VTLLQFRRVVPSSAWLRASILWADGLAAVWPMREPTPLNHAQEQPLQEVWSLLNAGLFERKYIYDLFSTTAEAGAIAQILDDALELTDLPHLRREALWCIPGPAGRDSKGGSWV